jgi:hypothetical protein
MGDDRTQERHSYGPSPGLGEDKFQEKGQEKKSRQDKTQE